MTTPDDDFAQRLRRHADALVPGLTVDTVRVLPRARRRRALTRTAGALAATLVLGGAGWVATAAQDGALPTSPADDASSGPTPLETAEPTAPAPSPTPDDGTSATGTSADAEGWPDANYWYTRVESVDVDGSTQISETWAGHHEPGLLVSDGDLTTAGAMGPSSWASLLVDGAWQLIRWDELYALPTEPAAVEALLRGSVEEDRGAGTPDDKIFEMGRGLVTRTPAAPALRTALWSVMTSLPDAVVTPGVTDAAGRTGTLVEYTDAVGNTFRLVMDPTTGRVLEERGVLPGVRSTVLIEAPADAPPVEPTIEMSGCVNWETC